MGVGWGNAKKWEEALKSQGRVGSGEKRTWEENEEWESRKEGSWGRGRPAPGKPKGRAQAGGGQKVLALTSRTLGVKIDCSPQSSYPHSPELAAKIFCLRAGGSEPDPEGSALSPSLPGGGDETGWGRD